MDEENKKIEVTKLFSEIHKTIKQCMKKSCEDIGLTLPQSIVIGTLVECGEMKTTELSGKINLSNSTISGIIDRLEKQQFIIRRRSETDRRIVYVKVAPKFEGIHEGLHREIYKIFEEILSTATEDELDKIVEGLSTFKNVLQSKNDCLKNDCQK